LGASEVVAAAASPDPEDSPDEGLTEAMASAAAPVPEASSAAALVAAATLPEALQLSKVNVLPAAAAESEKNRKPMGLADWSEASESVVSRSHDPGSASAARHTLARTVVGLAPEVWKRILSVSVAATVPRPQSVAEPPPVMTTSLPATRL